MLWRRREGRGSSERRPGPRDPRRLPGPRPVRGEALLVLTLVVLASTGGPAHAARRARAEPRVAATAAAADVQDLPSRGHVTYVARDHAYLSRGTAHGLAVGQTVRLSRGRLKLTCKVSAVAENAATCVGTNVLAGDRFSVSPPSEEKPPPRLPPLPPLAELDRRRERLQQAELPLVTYEPGQTLTRVPPQGQVYLNHRTWAFRNAGPGPFHAEELHASIGLALGKGLSFNGDLTAWYWPRRPTEAPLLRTSSQLMMRRAELAYTTPGKGWVGAAGRTWPRAAPGLPLLDGALVGWRSADQDLELGGFAGSLPDVLTLTPRMDSLTVGGFVSKTFRGSGMARWTRIQARLAQVKMPDQDSRIEAETAAHLFWWKRASATAQLRLAAPSRIGVESAQAYVDAEVLPRLTARAGLRYVDLPVLDPLNRLLTPLDERTFHGDASVRYALTPVMGVYLHSGVATHFDTSLQQRRVGTELELLRLVSGRGDFSLGHDEEFGWLRGRTTYAQLIARPMDDLRLLARVSRFQQFTTLGSEGYAGRETGVYADATVRLPWSFWGRASFQGRRDHSLRNRYGPSHPTALMGSATLGRDF